jgi:UDPglucose 6-dehydrogenase
MTTEWNAYRGLDLDHVMARTKGRVFCDLRNVYEPEHMSARGFAYAGVGR